MSAALPDLLERAAKPRGTSHLQSVTGGRATNGPLLSIVIPVYNEMAVLPLCHRRLRETLSPLDCRYELLFVDDGSTDGSAEHLAALAWTTPDTRLIRLSRNFGKEAAMTAGLRHARGTAVILLDADLQDPPELIPSMLEAWRGGADVVHMRRRTRAGEGWAKRASAHLFYRLLNRLSQLPIPEDTGDFRLLSRRAVDVLAALPERSRYLKGLFAWIGLPAVTLLYDRAPRAAGRSKWNLFSLVGLAFEGITSFSVAPLRWATGLGLLAALSGTAFGAWIVVKTMWLGELVAGYPSTIALVAFLSGVQLLSIGLLGEYVGKIYTESKQRPLYVIQELCEQPVAAASWAARAREDDHAAAG